MGAKFECKDFEGGARYERNTLRKDTPSATFYKDFAAVEAINFKCKMPIIIKGTRDGGLNSWLLCHLLRPPQGVCEACLHQVHKPCVSGVILAQNYGNV